MQPIITDTKTGVLYRKWTDTKTGCDAVFLLVHGLGAHSDRWNFLTKSLNENNVAAYGIELKGYGETKELKGHIDSFGTYYHDIESLHKIVGTEQPGKKVFILGESMGALIAFMSVLKNPGSYAGLICVSPAFVNKMQFPFSLYVKFIVSLLFKPSTLIRMPFKSEWITRDVDYQKTLNADIREIRDSSASTLLNILIAQLKCNLLKNKLNIPVLFLVAGTDMLVDDKSTKKLFEKMVVPDKTIKHYPEMYHALTIDQGRETVFQDIVSWVKTKLPV
jgi:alpha-beta hydrolase superfamily lysophospholipase